MAISNPRFSRHMPQLDGLRALAIAMVAWSHWMPDYCFGLALGHYGVHLFFVLSGFLITGILLEQRLAAATRAERFFVLRRFYIRRALRIFPLFYLTLAIGGLLDIPAFREAWLWNVSYLSNVYFFIRGAWNGPISHFWSLAVEEQFYCFWPFLVLFLPWRCLPGFITGVILVAPVFRVFLWLRFPGPQLFGVLTPACLDSLGVGALLAYASVSQGFLNLDRLSKSMLAAGLLGYGVIFATHGLSMVSQTCVALCFGWLVCRSAGGFGGLPGRILQCRVVVYCGKISYGIYVLHLLAGGVLDFVMFHLPGYRVFDRLHIPPGIYNHPAFRFPMLAAITILAAAAFWHFFENPINKLKRHFPYSKESDPSSVRF